MFFREGECPMRMFYINGLLYVSISFSSQYMDTTFCFSKISPVLPVMVGRVFVCFIRLPYLCGYCKVIRLETA